MIRVCINQPSSLQRHHKMHGTNAIAEDFDNRDQFVRIWLTEGDVISQDIETSALSCGWNLYHRRYSAKDSQCSQPKSNPQKKVDIYFEDSGLAYMGCPINCSGGCPQCSYAERGKLPANDEHEFDCHTRNFLDWLERSVNPLVKPGCTCKGEKCSQPQESSSSGKNSVNVRRIGSARRRAILSLPGPSPSSEKKRETKKPTACEIYAMPLSQPETDNRRSFLAIDGYDSWEEFTKDNCTRGPWPNPYINGTAHYKMHEQRDSVACNIDHKGGLISLYPDGSWSYDCAPDWNGAS